MTGDGWGYSEAGWGPDDTVAALNAGFAPLVWTGGAGSDGADWVKGEGAAAVPIPGPMALASCLYNNESVRHRLG